MQNTAFSTNKTLNIRGQLMDLQRPRVMGILNVTPDSFYDGGRFMADKAILSQTEKMLAEGADIIDVGGYSSRPGAEHINESTEGERALHAIKIILNEFPKAIISIDTFRSSIAEKAILSGAAMVNDISGGELDKNMFAVVAHYQVPYFIMHMKGTPQTMAQQASYSDLLKEIINYFHPKIDMLKSLGVKDIIIDPGFGFAKTREQNFDLLRELHLLQIFGCPILAGLSRKSMVWKTLDIKPEEALNGTTALNTIALMKGASMLRVHDVKAAVEVVNLFTRMGNISSE